jgi:hypothetical protein
VLANVLAGSDQRQNVPHFFDMGHKTGDIFTSILNARVGLTA